MIDANMTARRYKSLGHHTDGFDTLEAAEAFIRAEPRYDRMPEADWAWDGTDVPTLSLMIVPRNGDTPPTVAF
jgi:hypothetical protein